MNRDFRIKLISLILSLQVLTLSGCGKSNCNIEASHVHEYVSENGITRYSMSEKEKIGGFSSPIYYKTDNTIVLNDENIKKYKLISSNDLISINDNIDVLREITSNLNDYYLFQYKYVVHVSDPVYSINADGLPILIGYNEYDEDRFDWTSDPNHKDLTGEKKIMTHVYYGYRIVDNKIERSGIVDSLDLLIEMGFGYIGPSIYKEMEKDKYLKEIGLYGIYDDSNQYKEIYNGDRVELILK